jgi:hypothetical protein
MPFEAEMTQFDWELNPVENEPLRYTLMRRPVDERKPRLKYM